MLLQITHPINIKDTDGRQRVYKKNEFFQCVKRKHADVRERKNRNHERYGEEEGKTTIFKRVLKC